MSKNIENRRAFFKKIAQTALAVPFLAVAAKEVVAETQVGPSSSCGNCGVTCSGKCTGYCTANCGETCSGGCTNNCTATCRLVSKG